MFRSAKTYTYIWFIGLSYDMLNLEDHFPYFMAILLPEGPKNDKFWPKIAILATSGSSCLKMG